MRSPTLQSKNRAIRASIRREGARLPASIAERFERYRRRRLAISAAVNPRSCAASVIRVLKPITECYHYMITLSTSIAVEVLEYSSCQGLRDAADLREFLDGGAADRLDGAEAQEQVLLLPRADAGDLVQRGGKGVLPP